MAIETHVYDGSAWRKAKQIYVHDGSAWRDCKEAWCHDGSTWRKVFSKGWQIVTTSTSGLPGSVGDMFVYDGEIFASAVSGTFGSWGIQVYKWNGSSWSTLGSPIPTVNSDYGIFHDIPFKSADGVHIITLQEGKVYHYNGSAWVLDVDTYGAIYSPDNAIDNMIADGSYAYYPLGYASDVLTSWDGSALAYLGISGYPTSSVFFGGTIYAIASPDAGATYQVREWTGSAWPVHSTIGSDQDYVLRTDGTTLYAISLYGGAKKWNGSSWVTVSAIDTNTAYGRRHAVVNGYLVMDAASIGGQYPAVFSAGTEIAGLITDPGSGPIYFQHYVMSNGELYGIYPYGTTRAVYKWAGDLPP